MKVIIAGGRKYTEHEQAFRFLDYIRTLMTIDEVVVGGARGADAIGEMWAKSNGIPVKLFPAYWNLHGRKKAGTIRNEKMAEYADAVILFPGGAGTANMKRWATRKKLQIIDVVTELALLAIYRRMNNELSNRNGVERGGDEHDATREDPRTDHTVAG